ncbi:hypothetical protein BDDG_08172 [Blastomyces dermatitidis ATCC 18188]|uniref:Uncharacterized protein n=1 Tax=Ajellomyces dermatitidis (strain ATCC 18188 / CBS 674.68) TaxID=653446 RepID=F2TPR4_AJEDA|nr:hypothetical protein BDDG_08172 [Blastomyces dermatitidis ATCC 18188]
MAAMFQEAVVSTVLHIQHLCADKPRVGASQDGPGDHYSVTVWAILPMRYYIEHSFGQLPGIDSAPLVLYQTTYAYSGTSGKSKPRESQPTYVYGGMLPPDYRPGSLQKAYIHPKYTTPYK